MQSDLSDFFRIYALQPWEPGRVDCCLFLAAWAMWLGRKDPAPHLRGTYDSEDGFRAIIQDADGLVPVVQRCAEIIGAEQTRHACAGDIAVVGSASNIKRQFGAIFDGSRWNVRFINCVGPMTAQPLAIWRL